MAEAIIELKSVERHYVQGPRKLTILNGADFSLRRGEMVALVAPSGTGKSTLLHTAGLLERPDAGDVILSGRACGRLVNPELPAEDRRRAFYYSLKPNLLLSIHPDYVNYYLVTPVAPDRTTVDSEWLFHPDNQGDPAFHPEDAIGFWDVTNRQDWAIIERSQLGISSRRYQPGVYSARESIPAAWDRAYLQLMSGER